MSQHHRHSDQEICPQCDFEPFVRNHFFTGKMMGAAEFDTESHYHAEKMRHHNLRLHGWGVVCGLAVHRHRSAECRKQYLVVEPGTALDCCGREILLPQSEIVDIARHPAVQKVAGDGRLHTLELAICHRDCPTEEVPVLYDECGCDDTQCAPNRILESFGFEVRIDPPLTPGLGKTAALAAIVATDRQGATGVLPATAAGKIAVVDPGNASRAFVLDPPHRSLVSINLPAAAKGIALAPDELRFFVVTAPVAGTECEVHVYNVADGSEVLPVTANAVRKIPGSTAASVLLTAATTAGASALIVLDQAAGNLFRFPADAARGIADSDDGTPLAVPAGSDALAAELDGSFAYAVDPTDKIQVIDLTAGTTAALAGLPSSAKPVALAPFALGAAPMLGVASAGAGEQRLYILDRAAGTLTASIDVAHAPRFLAATGSATHPWLTLYEEEAGRAWVQSIDIEPLAAGSPALIAAPRALTSGVRHIVLVQAAGQVATVDLTALADSDCADHLRHQIDGCGGCEIPECVVLATLANYRVDMTMLDLPEAADDIAQGIARIDNLSARRLLATTATLQAWLECLQLKGGVPGPAGPAGTDGLDGNDGAPGAPGVLNVKLKIGDCATKPDLMLANQVLTLTLPECCRSDLVHICRVNWPHAEAILANRIQAIEIAFDGDLESADLSQQNLKQAFIVETSHQQIIDPEARFAVECWCQLSGEYGVLRLDKPCDRNAEPISGKPNTLRFFPSPAPQPGRTYRVRLHGDLIRDARGRGIDANHLPPWVSGGRPSGDCIEGGTFLSWFTVTQLQPG